MKKSRDSCLGSGLIGTGGLCFRRCGSLRSGFRFRDALFAQAGGLAPASTQIVQLSTADMRVSGYFDFFQTGRLEQERALHGYAMGSKTANSEAGIGAALAQAHERALKNLNALAVSLDDAQMHLDAIARPERRNIAIRLPFRDDTD